MKTNLSKWFSIRTPGKPGIGIKLKKQKANHDLSEEELHDFNKRIDYLRVNEMPSEWKILMNFGEFKEYEL